MSKETFVEASKIVVKSLKVKNWHSFMHYRRPCLTQDYSIFADPNLAQMANTKPTTEEMTITLFFLIKRLLP